MKYTMVWVPCFTTSCYYVSEPWERRAVTWWCVSYNFPHHRIYCYCTLQRIDWHMDTVKVASIVLQMYCRVTTSPLLCVQCYFISFLLVNSKKNTAENWPRKIRIWCKTYGSSNNYVTLNLPIFQYLPTICNTLSQSKEPLPCVT